MSVVPEKAERSQAERAEETGEFAATRNVLKLERGGPAVVAAHVGQTRKRPRRDDRAADGEAIETVGEVHGVGGTHNDNCRRHKKGHKRKRPEVSGEMRLIEQRVNHKIRVESLQEGKDELRRVSAVGGQHKKHNADDQTDENLEINLLLCSETKIALLRDFCVIINKADDGKTEKREYQKQDKW